jgi:two-component system CheB/CheR fusion protein
MVFKEVMEKLKPKKKITLQVFATDLDKDAIDKARQGIYPENICADVEPKQLCRFFKKEEHGCRVTTEIREMVIFAPQSLIMDPPFTKLDILSCRNLLIYLAPEMQKKLIPVFHYSLSPGGILLLGSAESVGTFTDLFAPLNNKLRIFRRTESVMRTAPIEFPSSFAAPLPAGTEAGLESKPSLSLQSVADQLMLEHYSPPAVLVNDKGNILYVSGRTGKYLEPAAGKANWNIFAMAREGLRYELGNAFHKALDQKDAVVVRGLKAATNGGKHHVDITVQRLEEPKPLRGLVMIIFADAAAPPETAAPRRGVKAENTPARNARLEELERSTMPCKVSAHLHHPFCVVLDIEIKRWRADRTDFLVLVDVFDF